MGTSGEELRAGGTGEKERKEEAHELRTSRPRGRRASVDARKAGQIAPIRLDAQI